MTNYNEPLVTIAIPTIGRLDFIEKAITSARMQTYRNLEIMISDNCIKTPYVLHQDHSGDKRIVIYRHDAKLKMAQHWNVCLNKAKGDYFLLLSDDDYLLPNAIHLLINTLIEKREYLNTSLIYGRSQAVTKTGLKLWQTRGTSSITEDYTSFCINFFANKRIIYPSATLYLVQAFKVAGGFPEEKVGTSADSAAFINVAKNSEVICSIPNIIMEYTVHPENTSTLAPVIDVRNNLTNLGLSALSNIDKCSEQIVRDKINYYISYVLYDVKLANISKKNSLWYIFKSLYISNKNVETPFVFSSYMRICMKSVYLKYFRRMS